MPKFRVTSPDGRTFDVTAPEGATQEDAIEYVKGQQSAQPEPAPPEPQARQSFFDEMDRPNPETNYGIMFPVARDKDAPEKRFAPPIILQDAYRALNAPKRILTGEVPSTPDALMAEGRNVAGMVSSVGPALTTIPKLAVPAGALTMNALTSKPVKAASRAASAIAQPIVDRFDQQGAMGRTLLKRVLQQNPGISPEEAIKLTEARMAELGPSAVLADTGESAQRLTRTMIQNPGESAPLAKDVLGRRQASEGTRTVESVRQNVSPKFFYDVEAAAKQSKKKAGPFYEKSYDENPNVSSLGMQLLLEQEPLVKQGINKGVELARIDASTARETFDPNRFGVVDFNEAGEPVLGQVTPLRLWHAAREGLDAMYQAEVDPITKEVTKLGGRIAGLRKSLDTEIKSLTGGDAGNFARADKIYADASKLQRALNDGRAFVKGDQELTEKHFASLSAKEKEAYRSGVAQEIIAMTRKMGSTPKQLIDSLKDESGVRAKLKVILPTTKKFDAFVKDIEKEVTFRETNRLRFGSQTFSLGQEDADTSAEVLGNMAQAGAQLARGNPVGAVTTVLSRAASAMKGAQMPKDTRNKLGKLLLSQDPADHAKAFQLMRDAQGSGWLYAP